MKNNKVLFLTSNKGPKKEYPNRSNNGSKI